MADDLQARLESHEKAFEGLMSLIPAKYYYGDDNVDDQWQRKKQTKEQKRLARKAKLDPEAYKSALDVHKEKELKRKRELEDEAGDLVDLDALEKPREGLKLKANVKKQKADGEIAENITADEAARRKAVADKRKEKRDRKKAKESKKREKADAKKGKKEGVNSKAQPVNKKVSKKVVEKKTNDDDEAASGSDDEEDDDDEDDDEEVPEVKVTAVEEENDDDEDTNENENDFEKLDLQGLVDEEEEEEEEEEDNDDEADEDSSSAASDTVEKQESSRPSIASSKSSIVPSPTDEAPKEATGETSDKTPKLPQIDQALLQQRLAARIEALRTARKADGLNGKPARNRQELLEARRQKEDQRRAHKKELRAQNKITRNVEEEAARLRGGSGSPLWSPAVLSPRVEKEEHNFSFGRVAFADGAEMNASLTDVVAPRKKKGPQDVKQALETAQRKAERIAGLDDEARADIADKDAWLNAKKRVHGEKIRDDTSLLKKTLKRRDKGKAKSEKEWSERTEGVKHGKEMKQKKRDTNLQKRKDEKGVKGKKKTPAPKKRAGFEGSFKAGGKRT